MADGTGLLGRNGPLFGGGGGGGFGGGGLFGHPAPAPNTWGQPRTPFARVFDSEKDGTITGFLGRIAGSPTASERTGAAMGEVMKRVGEMRTQGLSPAQVFTELTKDPKFSDMLFQSPDAGAVVTEILRGAMDYEPGGGADPMNVAPGGAIAAPQSDGTWGEVYRNPTQESQNFDYYTQKGLLNPAEVAVMARAALAKAQGGDNSQMEAATLAMFQAGKITEDEMIAMNGGLINVVQIPQNGGARIVDMRDGGLGKPWVPALGPGIPQPRTPDVTDQNAIEGGGDIEGGGGGALGDELAPQQGRYRHGLATAPAQYQSLYQRSGQRYGVDPDLLAAMGHQESGWNPKARSPAGAMGIAQFMPGTAREYGVNPWDPVSAIDGQARYMARYLKEFNGDVASALVAYNAGAGRARPYYKNRSTANLKGETIQYLAAIMGGKGHRNFISEIDDGVAAYTKQRPTLSFPRLQAPGTGGAYDMIGGGMDDMLEDAPGYGTGAEAEQLPLGLVELEDMEDVTAAEAASALGPWSSIGGEIDLIAEGFIGNSANVEPRVRRYRAFARTLQQNIIVWATQAGRDNVQEQQRLIGLGPQMGIFTSPSENIEKFLALRKDIENYNARDKKIVDAPVENEDGTAGRYSRLQHEQAAERILAGEMILDDLGTRAQLQRALERTKQSSYIQSPRYTLDALVPVPSIWEVIFGPEPGQAAGLDEPTFAEIAKAWRDTGVLPPDEVFNQLTPEQAEQLLQLRAD